MDRSIDPLSALLVGQFASGHGVDAVNYGEVNGPRGNEIGGDARYAEAWICGLSHGLRRAFGRRARSGVHGTSEADGDDGGFVFGHLVAVDCARRDAETVFHR